MKFEEFYIKFKPENEEEIVKTLESMGFSEKENYDSKGGFISTYESGRFRKIDINYFKNQPLYTFEQFMQKYGSNRMIEKINQAKKQLNFNNKQLSEALGYSRQYITKMLNLPQSENIQDKVCKEIDGLLNKFNHDSVQPNCDIDQLNAKHAEELTGYIVDNDNLKSLLSEKDREILVLRKDVGIINSKHKKEIEQKQLVINKLDDQLIRAEKVHNEDVKSLNEAHSIIHIKNQRIDGLERDIDGNNIEIKELNQAYIEVCDAQNWAKNRIVCERWLFLIIIAILSAVVVFK